MEVIWPDGKIQELVDVDANQSLQLNYRFAETKVKEENKTDLLFTKVTFDNRHSDPYFNDFDLQILLPHKLSQLGPSLAKADINGDGEEDVFIGGGKDQPGQLLVSRSNSFQKTSSPALVEDKSYEDVGATFFDADGDGDNDLYVVSGSYEFKENPRMLVDRLYLNDGKGNFEKAENAIPEVGISGSVVVPSDYDGDGDIDLFIGGRLITGKYPHPASSLLLVNDAGKFTIENENLAPGLQGLGLVTDAKWVDINNDQKVDLVVTGEWMGIQVFLNKNNELERSDAYPELANAVGWWNELLIDDIDGDGDKDIVAGNMGLNSKFHASYEKPFEIYTSDFDMNGSQDVILAKEYQGKQVPVRGKGCMTQQLPHLAQTIPTYTDFASKDLKGIVGEGLQTALHYKATEFRSGIFINNGDKFSFQPFENRIQIAPINSILFQDFDNDGLKDLLLAGNNYQSEVETTRSDAGIGTFLKGNGKGEFMSISSLKSGFFADKDVRNMTILNTKAGSFILVVNNNDKHDLFKIKTATN